MASRCFFVGSLTVLFLGTISLALLMSPSVAVAGVPGGGGQTCCDCWVRTVTRVETSAGVTYDFVWDWVDCDDAGGGSGGGSGGGGGGDDGGGGGTGGGSGGDPRDTTPEAKAESAMCEVDNVVRLYGGDRCLVAQAPPDDCCLQSSNDGHLCTTCDCAGCCQGSGYDSPSEITACLLQCAIGFSHASSAAGIDDSSTCMYYSGDDGGGDANNGGGGTGL